MSLSHIPLSMPLTPSLPSRIDPNVFPKNSCRKISIVYEKSSFEVCLSNRKIYVYKKKYTNQDQASSSNLVDL